MPLLPPLLLNSVPKSGTHLMKQILLGIPGVAHHPRNEFYEGLRKDDKENYTRLSLIKPNEFAAGHVYYSPEWAGMLQQLGMKHIFVIRDLRDVVVSYVYFIVYKYPYHPLVDYLRHDLKTPKERYLTLINGIKTDNIQYPSIAEWFDSFIGWVRAPHTLLITYEQLMESPVTRRAALSAILDYWMSDSPLPAVKEEWMRRMEQNINPSQSLTFRSGKIGDWRTEFDEEVKEAFKRVTGNRLIQLGYERDNLW